MPDVAVDVHHLLDELRAARSNECPRHEPLRRIGDPSEVIAALRIVREHGPGQLRAVALDALMFLGGPSALDPAPERPHQCTGGQPPDSSEPISPSTSTTPVLTCDAYVTGLPNDDGETTGVPEQLAQRLVASRVL